MNDNDQRFSATILFIALGFICGAVLAISSNIAGIRRALEERLPAPPAAAAPATSGGETR